VVADASTDTLTLVAGSNVTITTDADADSVTIAAASGGTMTSFQLEDSIGPGVEVAISDGKEVKLIGGPGITTEWTDTSHGTDGDPYDMTIAATGSAGSALYSADGPHRFFQRPSSNLKADVSDPSAENEDPLGRVIELVTTAEENPAVAIRSVVPHGAEKVRFEMMFRGLAHTAATGDKIELRIAGRLVTNKGTSEQTVHMTTLSTGNTNNTSGHWLDSGADMGWRFITTQNSGAIITQNTNFLVVTSQTYGINNLINTNDASNNYQGAGDVIDYMIARNRSTSQIGSTTDTVADSVLLAYVKVIYDYQ
jgi:hypothetical protein